MTFRLNLASALAVALATAVSPVSAMANDEIGLRQNNHQKRIAEGFRAGLLTRHEYVILQAEQARIGELYRVALTDGVVDTTERTQIMRAQQEAGRHIYIRKHDAETRWGYYRPVYRAWWQGL